MEDSENGPGLMPALSSLALDGDAEGDSILADLACIECVPYLCGSDCGWSDVVGYEL